MGVNTRTYKFALAQALLEHARQGRADVTLRELAQPYAMSLVQHLQEAPHVSEALSLRDSDFLSIARAEAAGTVRAGAPTDRLLDAATRSMPAMVMQKFHNLRGGTKIPHRFYELSGSASERIVRLTPELITVAASEQGADAAARTPRPVAHR
jgi:hypothetical protein